MSRPFKRPSLILILVLAARSGSRGLRGGSQRKRDRWFGLEDYADFEDFKRWWHREGKDAAGGFDLTSAAQARAAYKEWADLGKPRAK
jgi:hypothetical protein